MYHCWGQALFSRIIYQLTTPCKLRIPTSAITGDTRRVLTSVVERGNNPRPPAKVPKYMLSGKRCGKAGRLEVAREAAVLRKRNSSLVESACAEDLTGLNISPKLRMLIYRHGRGAFCKPSKGKTVRHPGGIRSANVDMSNDKGGEKPPAGRPRVPVQR